jgi:hypothetical protein
MKAKTLFVAAADEAYFPLLKGLILSIHEHQPDARRPIGVLNLGMTSPQLQELASLGCITATPVWDFDFPNRDQASPWLRAMTARCHLPRYFPGAQTYIWLDADVWLQDWRAIDLLERASADGGGIAIVPEIHRAYGAMYVKGNMTDQNNQIFFAEYAVAYGEPMARQMMCVPIFNSGVFALRHDSTAWQAWKNWMARGLKSGIRKLTEQNALNAAIYSGEIQTYPLPANCNWICGQSRPKFDAAKKIFVEPLLPHEPISILHVTPGTLRAKQTIQTLDGQQLLMPLDYLPFRASL